MDFVERYFDKSWYWEGIFCHPNLTFEFLLKHNNIFEQYYEDLFAFHPIERHTILYNNFTKEKEKIY